MIAGRCHMTLKHHEKKRENPTHCSSLQKQSLYCNTAVMQYLMKAVRLKHCNILIFFVSYRSVNDFLFICTYKK